MPRVLVALDLDGTLLDHSVVPTGHEHAIRELQAMQAEVCIVTGRTLGTSRWVHEHLRLRGPLVCFNGGWVGYPGQEPFAVSRLAQADVHDIVAELRDVPGSISCYPDAVTWIMSRELPFMQDWRQKYRTAITIDAERIHAWEGPSGKVMFVGQPQALPAVVQHLRGRFAHRFHIVFSEPDRFEISQHGVTKAWGLERLAAHLRIERSQVWAVGDAANDREMIAWAGHGCAMGQADEELRRQARHILPGIAARGLCALPGLIRSQS